MSRYLIRFIIHMQFHNFYHAGRHFLRDTISSACHDSQSAVSGNLQVLHMVMGLERLERITAFIDEASEAGIGDMAPSEPHESEDSYQDAGESRRQILSQRSGQLPQKISVEQQVCTASIIISIAATPMVLLTITPTISSMRMLQHVVYLQALFSSLPRPVGLRALQGWLPDMRSLER